MARAAVGFSGVTAGVKIISLAKEAVVAAGFGVSGAMDAYLMGLMLIGVPMGILLNAIVMAFTPLCMEVREAEGPRSKALFLRSAATLTLFSMATALLLWLLLLPLLLGIVGHGFDPTKRALVREIFLWLVPYYFLNGLNLLGHGALQAEKQFVTSALAPLCTSLATIAIVLAGRGDIHALALSMVLGSLLEWGMVQWRLRRCGLSLIPGILVDSTHLRSLAKGSGVLLGGALVIPFSPMIEQGIASGLSKGTVAAMGYANKLPVLLSSILVTSVGVTVLPFFAEMLAKRDIARCLRAFRTYAFVLIVGGSLLVLCLAGLSEPLVAFAYQRGAFHANDTHLVAQIQRAYLVQIPAALVAALAMRLLIAHGSFKLVAAINFGSVVAGGMLAWLLSRQMGAVGIALGLSVAATFSGLIWFAMALRIFSQNHQIGPDDPGIPLSTREYFKGPVE